MHRQLTVKPFLPAIGWFIITFVLLVLPGDDLPTGFFSDIPMFDKFVHLFMFFLLTVLFSQPFLRKHYWHYATASLFLKIASLTVLYGILMEFVQKYFVRNRSFDLVDILVDAVGSLAAMWLINQINKLQKNRPR